MLMALVLGLLPQTSQETKLQLPTVTPMFAFAKASQSGKSIAISFGDRGKTRQETYTVNIPVTQTRVDKDGNERRVTIMMPSTRTRVVRSNAPSIPVQYTVERPVQRQIKDKDGNVRTDTVTVKETRTRMVQVGGKDGKPTIHKITDCRITDLEGKPVDAEEISKRLSKSSPVVLLYGQHKLDPFYRVALNPNMLLISPPLPKPSKDAEIDSDDGWTSDEDPFSPPPPPPGK